MSEHNDIAGNELAIGDKVAFTKTPNKGNELKFGWVTGFTPQKVTIASTKDGPTKKSLVVNSWKDKNVECKFPNQVAKLFNQNT